MKYHLDTTFLIDWRRGDDRIVALRDEITRGDHDVSIDTIVQTEFFSARDLNRMHHVVFEAILTLGAVHSIDRDSAALAASWLATMDRPQHRARFADALIAAVAVTRNAVLVTSDRGFATAFPVAVLQY